VTDRHRHAANHGNKGWIAAHDSDWAVLDPELTRGCSRMSPRATGIDAMGMRRGYTSK